MSLPDKAVEIQSRFRVDFVPISGWPAAGRGTRIPASMIKSAVTVSLVPEAQGGPFVFWGDLPGACRKARALEFDAVEVFPPDPESIDAAGLQKLLNENGLALAAFGTGGGWLRQKLTLTAADADVRSRARAFIRRMIDQAAPFQSRVILGSMQGRWEGAVSRDQAVAWLAEGLEELGDHAAKQGVTLLYEHLNRYETNLFNRVEQVVPFLQGLSTKNVRILADLFHLNIEEQSLPEALRACGDLLGHVHFVDSNRRAAGWGHTDFPPIISALRQMGYQGFLSAECFAYPDSDRAAGQTIARFRELTR